MAVLALTVFGTSGTEARICCGCTTNCPPPTVFIYNVQLSGLDAPPSTTFTGKSATLSWQTGPSGSCDSVYIYSTGVWYYPACGTHTVTATGLTVHVTNSYVIHAAYSGYTTGTYSGSFHVSDVSTSNWAQEDDPLTFTFSPGGLLPPACNGYSMTYEQAASTPGDVVFSTTTNEHMYIQTSMTDQYVYCDALQTTILGVRHLHQNVFVYDDDHPFTSTTEWLGGYMVEPTDATIAVSGSVSFSVTAGATYGAGNIGISASTNNGIYALQALATTQSQALQSDGSLKVGSVDVEWNAAYQRPTIKAAYDVTVFSSAAGFQLDRLRIVVQNQYTFSEVGCVLPNTFCSWGDSTNTYVTQTITLGDGSTPYAYATAGSVDTMADLQTGAESQSGTIFPGG